MKFMIFVKSNPTLEKSIDAMTDAALKPSMAEMNAFNDELKKAGVIKDCDGLRPSREGKRVRFDGKSRTVVVAHSKVTRWLDIGSGNCPASRTP